MDFNYLAQPSRLADIAICDSEAARPSWGAGASQNRIGALAHVRSPQPRSFSRRMNEMREKRERHPYTFAKPLVHRRPSISSTSPSPSSSCSFRGEPIPQKRLHAFPLTYARMCECAGKDPHTVETYAFVHVWDEGELQLA